MLFLLTVLWFNSRKRWHIYKTWYISFLDDYFKAYLCTRLYVGHLLQHRCLCISFAKLFFWNIWRASVQLLIYTKTLSLSMWNFSSHAVSVGQIVNHLSVDANNMMFCCCVIHFVWLLPLKVGFSVSYLYGIMEQLLSCQTDDLWVAYLNPSCGTIT